MATPLDSFGQAEPFASGFPALEAEVAAARTRLHERAHIAVEERRDAAAESSAPSAAPQPPASDEVATAGQAEADSPLTAAAAEVAPDWAHGPALPPASPSNPGWGSSSAAGGVWSGGWGGGWSDTQPLQDNSERLNIWGGTWDPPAVDGPGVSAEEMAAARALDASELLDDEVPAEFMCPITQELMIDPVVTSDGNTFERHAITAWLQT